MQPVRFRGPKSKRDRTGIRWATPAFSKAQKWAELLRNPCILGGPNATRGEKIRSGYLGLAFSEVPKGAELLRNPCILGGPNAKRWENFVYMPLRRSSGSKIIRGLCNTSKGIY